MSTITDTKDTRLVIPALAPLYSALEPAAFTLFRVVIGLFLAPHGAQKLFAWFGGYGLEGTGGFFDSIGLTPGYTIALLAGSVEFFGGLALAFGLLTRPAAVAVTVLLLVASTLHFGKGFFWTDGGFEYPILWAAATLYLAIRGGGRYSLDRVIGRTF